MSNFQTITPVVEGLAGSAPQIWSAVTTDSASTVMGAGYLNDIALKLGIKANDVFYINTSDSSTFPMQTGLSATLELYECVYSGGNWSLVISNPDNFAQFTPPSVLNAIPYFTNTTGLMGNSPFLVSGNLFVDSAADALTAHSGGGQTSALALTHDVNRVTTVAASGDSVKLPASAPGLKVWVINSGANPMQVFGNGTDTINGVASATGVSQLPGGVCLYECSVAGSWFSSDIAFGANGNFYTVSQVNGLTAHSGGGQASALALTASINEITTVAAAGDSVALPASAAGMEITIINYSSTPMQVFGAGTDTINGVATATGVSQPGKSVVTYRCVVAGNWIGNLGTLKGTGTVSANAVTINAQAGVITTGSLSTASGANATAITLTNSFITASSVILCQLMGGTNTTLGVTFNAVPGAGSATITITNGNVAAAALNGTLIIGFAVL